MSENTNTSKKSKKGTNIFAVAAQWLKTHKAEDALIVFAIIELAMILLGILFLQEPVVPVCIVLIAAAGIAALMHNVELWIHGAVILVELIAGILIGRLPLMILCVVMYIVTTATMKLYYTERNKQNG